MSQHHTEGEAKGSLVPSWALLSMAIVFGANLVAIRMTGVTIELMRSRSPFAMEVRAHDEAWIPMFRIVAFVMPVLVGVVYLIPLATYFRRGCPQPAPATVERRAISGPLSFAGFGFLSWLGSVIFFPALTVIHFGRWSADLMSQHVLSPVVNGFLAATISYLLIDWVFRRQVIPRVFPRGRVADVSGAFALGVRGRMLVFLTAVGFVPLFTLLGLVRAAGDRLRSGQASGDVMGQLIHASEVTFAFYVVLGTVLTLLMAATLNRSVRSMVQALRRVRANDLDVRVAVTSSDEVGVLEDGVNAMVETLREKERILATFGRVVEPSVRDHLLAGAVEGGGELRLATVLFCDLVGFSRMAEHTPPRDVVATLNEFFTAMTTWVRTCGGFVDKFVGDGMLVVFGLLTDGDRPDAEAHAAAAAIRCALGMRERVVALNEARATQGRAPLAVKVGVHSGELVAGTIGAVDRHEYTVIGDTVNVAARLQQLCAEAGRDVLVSDATFHLAKRAGYTPQVSATSTATLRGREASVVVYGLV
jgi:adenylate cyclase